MRICYIWTESFKNLRNFGINIRNDLRFSYDPETQLLSREKQASLPPEILGDQILDATAILGINGAGKTNALELICLALKGHEKLQQPTLIVYEFHGDFFYVNNTHQKIQAGFLIQKKIDLKDFKDLNVIYFSNVFDQSQLNLGKYVLDISTNFRHSHRNPKLGNDPDFDIISQLKFIQSEKFRAIKITPPKHIEIKIERYTRPSNNDKISKYSELFRRITSQQQTLRKQAHTDDAKLAAGAIQGQFLHQILLTHNSDEALAKIVDKTLYSSENERVDFRPALIEAKNFLTENNFKNIWGQEVNVAQLIDTLLDLEHYFNLMHIRLDESLKSSRYSFTFDFYDNLDLPYYEISIIIWTIRSGSINWTGISSGQRAYLNMFSSIWSTLSRARTAKSKSIGTLLCIDEADLYLHPKWQVEFMERLITCLPELSEQKTQIVITTHSPILVSDLPSQCLTTLPAQTPTDASNPPANDIKTFGANLFDIYESTFGLKGQRTGNISSKYISKILRILDADQITPEKIEVLQQASSIIDDQLIKSHIIKRIKNK